MKLRLSSSGLRLRLTGEDLSALRLGQPVSESTRFPNGLFFYTLMAGAEQIGASLTDHGVAVTLPEALLGELEEGNPVSAELQTSGQALVVLIEKDRRPERD